MAKRELLPHLLGAAVLGIGGPACGGAESAEEVPFGVVPPPLAQRLTGLRARPTCYQSAPEVMPANLSQTYVDEIDAANLKRETGATYCVERYQRLFAQVAAEPLQSRWSFRDTIHNQDIVATAQDVRVGQDSGYLQFEVARLPTGTENPVDWDPCMRRATEMEVQVYFDAEMGDMVHNRLAITWGDEVTLVTKPGPGGVPYPLLYRGCDASADASFGRAERYLDSEPVSCWRDDRFIDCASVQVWPELP